MLLYTISESQFLVLENVCLALEFLFSLLFLSLLALDLLFCCANIGLKLSNFIFEVVYLPLGCFSLIF